MKKIYFVCVWNFSKKSTDYFRGIYIENNIKKINNCEIVCIKFNDLLKSVDKFKKDIFVLVRGYTSGIEMFSSIFEKLKNNNNILIHDILDIYSQENEWYKNKKYIDFENLFDYLIVNSNYMMDELKKVFNQKMLIIHHSYDHRFKPTNIIEDKVCYYGSKEKVSINNPKFNYFSNVNYWLNSTVHFTFLPKTHPYYFNHNTTKLATALCNNCIFVSNRIPIFVELLGENYPFFSDDTEENFYETIKKARETLTNLVLYGEYIKKIEPIKKLLSPETMLENYKLFFTDLINNYSFNSL